MAKKEVLRVRIRKNRQNPQQCIVGHQFVARPGSIVTFEFPEEPTAVIMFPQNDSPFEKPAFTPGKRTVRADARGGTVSFIVGWSPRGGGSGNGTGEVVNR